MHDLIIAPEQLPGALTEADVTSVLGYAANAMSEATRRAYNQDQDQFRQWCATRGACPLPASPAVLCAYLAHLADSGRKAAGIGRAAAGIAWHHKQAGISPGPTVHEAVKQTMRGIRRSIGSAKQGKAPIVAAMLMEMLKHCEGDALIQKRDRAILSLAFCGAFRRSEVCALEVADLTDTPDGYRILIRRSKTDQLGEGAEIALIRGTRIRAVVAVQDWIAAAGLERGPLFRAIALGGRMSDTALTPGAFARIIKSYCRKIGVDPAGYSGHSMRAGMITSSAEAGASIFKISEVSRHRSIEVLRNYVRKTDIFREHATASFA